MKNKNPNGIAVVKFAIGLVLVILFITLCYILMKGASNFVSNAMSDAPIDTGGDYAIETPEPLPTMPAEMLDDSYYDDAGKMNGEG